MSTAYRLDHRRVGVESRWGQEFSPHRPDRLLRSTEPPIQWVPGALSPGVKRPGRLTTHLQLVPRSRKCGSIHPLPHTPSWRSAYLVKHRDNFTFTLVDALYHSVCVQLKSEREKSLLAGRNVWIILIYITPCSPFNVSQLFGGTSLPSSGTQHKSRWQVGWFSNGLHGGISQNSGSQPFVWPQPSKFFFYKTRTQSQQIYS
jgi:hypothetical protein